MNSSQPPAKGIIATIAAVVVLLNGAVDYYVLFPLGVYDIFAADDNQDLANLIVGFVGIADLVKLVGALVILTLPFRTTRITASIAQIIAAVATMALAVVAIVATVYVWLGCGILREATGCNDDAVFSVLVGQLGSVLLAGGVVGLAVTTAVVSRRRTMPSPAVRSENAGLHRRS